MIIRYQKKFLICLLIAQILLLVTPVGKIYAAPITFSKVTGANNPLNGVGAQTASTTSGSIDYNSDGYDDLAIRTSDDRSVDVWKNNGDGTFTKLTGTSSPFYGINFGDGTANPIIFQPGASCVFGDWDGDGDTDIWNARYNEMYRNDNGVFTKVTGTSNPLNGVGAQTANTKSGSIDYNSDGYDDLAIRTSDDRSVDVWKNNGDGTFTKLTGTSSPFYGINFGDGTANPIIFQPGTSCVFGDWDGDGDTDIWNARYNEMYRNDNGVFTKVTGISNPLNGVGAQTANTTSGSIDYNSDGYDDLAIRTSDNRSVDVWKNNGDGTFTKLTGTSSPFYGINFGDGTANPIIFQPGASCVFGDWDSDGDTDIWNARYNEMYVQSDSPPKLIGSTPVNNGTNFTPSGNIVLNFNEPIASAGNKTIKIYRSSDKSVVESIEANSARVTGIGTNSITIDPNVTLLDNTTYYVTIEKSAFFDIDGQTYQGIKKSNLFKFTTGTSTTPTYTIATIGDQSLTAVTGGYTGGTQETKSVTITRTGTGDLANLAVALSGTNAADFEITQPLAPTLNGGTPSTTFTVKAKDGLAAGTYTATVTVTATNMTAQTFTVTQVVGAAPTYTISPIADQTLTGLTAGYTGGTQETKSVTITRTGTGDLANLAVALSGTNAADFEITQPLAPTLNGGTPSTTFTVKAKDGLAAGTYTATVTVTATNMTAQTFTVTQVVGAVPTYTISPIADQTLTGLTAGYTGGTQETKSVTITRTGTGDLANLAVALSGTNAADFEITQPLAPTLNGGTPSTTFTVKAKDGLAAGTYTATVTVTATNMTAQTFTVTQVVGAVPTYTISPIADQTLTGLTAGYTGGTQETKSVTITRTGTGDLANLAVALSGTNGNDFEITQPLAPTLNGGTPSTTFTVKAKDGLAAGTYTATVTVTATNMTAQTFTVTQVVGAAPTYTISPIADQTLTGLTAGYTGGTQETKSVTITRTGTGDLANLAVALSGTNGNDFEITQPLAPTLNGGTPSTTFTVKAKDGLAAGTYTATVTVTATNMTAQTFTVTQVVGAVPTYTISPIADQTLTGLTAGYTGGTQETKSVTITRNGTGDLANLAVALSGTNGNDFEITQPLAPTLNGGTPSTTFTVKAKDGLAAGTYTATVTVTATNMTAQTFTVTQVVGAAPTYTISPIADQTLTGLTAGYTGGTQETKSVMITRTGTGDLANLAVELSGTNGNDFEITQPLAPMLNGGTPSTTFTVKAKDGLAAGTYTATVTVTATNMTAQTFTVTQVVGAAPTYTISPIADQTLTGLTAGYTGGTQETKSVTITRTGTGDLANLAVALSGTNGNDFEITQPLAPTLNGGTPSTTFTVKAKDGLAAGTYTATVTVTATNMSAQTFTVIQVVSTESAQNASLSLSTANFDKKTENQSDVVIAMTLHGNMFNGIQHGGAMLTEGMDYTVTSGDTVTIKKEYLEKQSLGTVTLLFIFNGGQPQNLAITISNTTPIPAAPSVTANDITNKLVGADGTMEYSTNNGMNWMTYDPGNEPVFNGTFTVLVRVKASGHIPAGATTSVSFTTNPSANTGGGGGGGSSTPTQSTTSSTPNTWVEVLVNGKAENAGIVSTTKVNDQTVTTIAVDPKKLDDKLAAEGQHAIITIPVKTKSDVLVGELTGQMVKNMERKQAVIEIKTDKASYTVPAQQINIDAVSEQIGKSVNLQDIKVKIEISKPTAETTKIVENAAVKGEFTIVALPLNFTVKGTYGDKTIDVFKFNAYVERTIAIPDGVDPNKITTGVVVEPDGTVRHVPTKVVKIDGKYFAKIHSLTNSTYSIVWHPLEFKDVEKHWAKNAVNDMGSRMVISGVGHDLFNPDQDITRAEFAAIMVRGLGIKQEDGAVPFTDVKAADWYSGAVQAAYKYNLIRGFEDGTFRPNDKITREQAMAIIAKAMKITDLQAKLQPKEAGELLLPFIDAKQASEWAKEGVADCVQAGLVSGRNGQQLAPKEFISRAEVAAIVQRLLQKSELI
ncbi:DUF4073 domain-containing protein [Aneurinibacillus uraniidurans]|uniref:DUF4073 domain-containing protein n=1 Tax=Aneurinibacillus uraniidurans TaxID=2966586 RepID=UPI002349E77E|nr:DUF4073 domain-containing protein [Aneurinibacillus sp. B1]WCN38340.1 DUF4073 domain-containing protein [Aneurinibacillus sp. B1]